MKVFGIVGWKNSGKTTLVAKLVTELKTRGFSASTVKHAHHKFDLDQPGRDSYQHRKAGAQEVLISSGKRWALMHELEGRDECRLDDLLAKMTPVDIVLVEGFKNDAHAKIECHRAASEMPLVSAANKTIVAVASDVAVDAGGLRCLDLNDITQIADFVMAETGLVK
ncbi:MAG: molybdopterin-guanine dinucleotide biosynthesis protein B [Rhodobacterales bacterium]